MANLINLEPYVNSEGKITQFPHKQGAKQAVLVYLAQRFDTNRFYSEKEINAICEAWHTFGDYFLLRRELVDHGLLCRTPDGARYWKPEEDCFPPAVVRTAPLRP